jgi:hypothetical protein
MRPMPGMNGHHLPILELLSNQAVSSRQREASPQESVALGAGIDEVELANFCVASEVLSVLPEYRKNSQAVHFCLALTRKKWLLSEELVAVESAQFHSRDSNRTRTRTLDPRQVAWAGAER